MNFSLFITGSPTATRACHSALDFAQAILDSEVHHLKGVFFYEEATHIASQFAMPPRDECNIRDEWAALAQANNISLYVCIAAAIRRGIVNDAEATRHELPASNLAEGFQLEGLGTWVSLSNECDRVVRFC